MNTVKIIVEGYAKVNFGGTWDATSTTTLIDTGKHKILVDPGCHRQMLLSSLSQNSISVDDIDYVFITHYHLDHCFLMGIFPNATVFDGTQYQRDSIGGEVGEYLPDTNIKIIKTPGHVPEMSSLLVPNRKGSILVAGDVFWWREDETQAINLNKPDNFASDFPELVKSRQKALTIAKYIIPGHGQMFAKPKQTRNGGVNYSF